MITELTTTAIESSQSIVPQSFGSVDYFNVSDYTAIDTMQPKYLLVDNLTKLRSDEKVLFTYIRISKVISALQMASKYFSQIVE